MPTPPHCQGEPLYAQVAHALRGQILSGRLEVGARLPTEAELCQAHHVSRVTVRRALDGLAREGFVVRRRPTGTFVADWAGRATRGHYTEATGFTADLREQGITARTMRVSIELATPDRQVASVLELGPGENAAVLRRVRGSGREGHERAFALFVTAFTPFDGLPLEPTAYYGSFYQLLREHGIVPRRVQECTEAVSPTPDVAEALGVRRSQPILKRTIVTRQEDGPFREYSECFYMGSEYRYYVRFS
ncbi:GntR family transcriptional regulator [Thermophilibacter sp.]